MGTGVGVGSGVGVGVGDGVGVGVGTGVTITAIRGIGVLVGVKRGVKTGAAEGSAVGATSIVAAGRAQANRNRSHRIHIHLFKGDPFLMGTSLVYWKKLYLYLTRAARQKQARAGKELEKLFLPSIRFIDRFKIQSVG